MAKSAKRCFSGSNEALLQQSWDQLLGVSGLEVSRKRKRAGGRREELADSEKERKGVGRVVKAKVPNKPEGEDEEENEHKEDEEGREGARTEMDRGEMIEKEVDADDVEEEDEEEEEHEQEEEEEEEEKEQQDEENDEEEEEENEEGDEGGGDGEKEGGEEEEEGLGEEEEEEEGEESEEAEAEEDEEEEEEEEEEETKREEEEEEDAAGEGSVEGYLYAGGHFPLESPRTVVGSEAGRLASGSPRLRQRHSHRLRGPPAGRDSNVASSPASQAAGARLDEPGPLEPAVSTGPGRGGGVPDKLSPLELAGLAGELLPGPMVGRDLVWPAVSTSASAVCTSAFAGAPLTPLGHGGLAAAAAAAVAMQPFFHSAASNEFDACSPHSLAHLVGLEPSTGAKMPATLAALPPPPPPGHLGPAGTNCPAASFSGLPPMLAAAAAAAALASGRFSTGSPLSGPDETGLPGSTDSARLAGTPFNPTTPTSSMMMMMMMPPPPPPPISTLPTGFGFTGLPSSPGGSFLTTSAPSLANNLCPTSSACFFPSVFPVTSAPIPSAPSTTIPTQFSGPLTASSSSSSACSSAASSSSSSSS
ncbi:unnamed protein product, partial [Protopolystoma xenopodis]